MLRDWLWFAAVLILLATVTTLFLPAVTPVPFAYDESDYMYAGSRGVWANYWDSPSQSLPEFVKLGLELKANKDRRQGMSEYIRELGDIDFYRHYHGPVYAMWIALCHAAGVSTERGYRESGLILHGIIVVLIFWGFRRIFPSLPAGAAFVASAVYALDRTSLDAAVTITQHEPFALAAALALLALGMFVATRKMGYWYACAAALGIAFATVEISVILDGAAILAVVMLWWHDGWRRIASIILKGLAAFVAACTVVWPKSILGGAAIKGYLYLGYMALSRKTFTPIGPGALWGFKLRTYPWEFVTLLGCFAAVLLAYRWLTHRRETLPFLLYSALFIGATLAVTLEYTYYHVSLFVALAVLAGVAVGEIWKRVRWGAVAAVAVVGTQVVMASQFQPELDRLSREPSWTADMLAYIKANHVSRVVAPFPYVPPLHYYLPEVKVTGVDSDWDAARIASALSALGSPVELICIEKDCRRWETGLPAGWIQGEERFPTPSLDGPMWAYHIGRASSD